MKWVDHNVGTNYWKSTMSSIWKPIVIEQNFKKKVLQSNNGIKGNSQNLLATAEKPVVGE